MICWGRSEYRLERNEISSLSVLKEEVSVVYVYVLLMIRS